MHYGYSTLDTSKGWEPFCQGQIFLDQAGDEKTPAFQELLETLNEGDSVTIPSMSCLGSSLSQMSARWQLLTDRDVDVSVLDFPELKTRDGYFSRIMGYLLGTEREMRRQKQTLGIARARTTGVRLGRKPKEIPEEFEEIRQQYMAGRFSARQAAAELDVSHTTFLRWCRQVSQE